MASPKPRVLDTPNIRNIFGKLALTNYYQVDFSGLAANGGSTKLINHLKETTFKDADDKLIVNKFITNDAGLLCVDASLPSSSFATAEVKDNFMGVTQEFAHTRIYTDSDFTFYIDTDYFLLRFFEGWMDFISGGGERAQIDLAPGYYRRFVYPDDYKVNALTITKFERNYKIENSSVLVYTFVNAFPKTLTPVAVSYGSADLLKVTVSFNFDRYIVERKYIAQDIELLQQQFIRQLGNRSTNIPGTTNFGLTGAGTASELNQGLA